MILEKRYNEHQQVISSTVILEPYDSDGVFDNVAGEVALDAIGTLCGGVYADPAKTKGFDLFYYHDIPPTDAIELQARLSKVLDDLNKFESLAKMRVEIVKRKKAEGKA